ncbi:DUF1361 domain-containing protein [Aerosakkonema funiforme]|uniref:DUF1361 domain-containing protein n=1 Tax=Aerosakkonema funiforme FACHB-1375 TaxID=2949571 RepID=A0A926ZK78_9CYAN|nr:DUF1361 domain-containing protein [Aerosakkonema funiforme]MBD2185484.1 DUF1361 domain-containing protein [Aerosakkonema funiforme FACHB-1375]
MLENLIYWLQMAGQLLLKNSGWMAWNLFLALLPFALSVWLFSRPRWRYYWWIGLLLLATFLPKAPFILEYAIRFMRDNRTNYLVWAITLILIALDIWLLRSSRSRSFKWWLGFLVFIAFLPNAPYVLTDIIHLIEDIRENYSVWMITLVLIPQYLLFILVGFEAYVLSLINLGNYLKQQGWGKFVLGVELLIHALSAIGIYLGRFLRFNSWDLVTELDNVAGSVVDDLTAKRPILLMTITFAIVTGLYWLMKQVSLGIMLRNSQAIAHSEENYNADRSNAL